jgi:hypothetical protein
MNAEWGRSRLRAAGAFALGKTVTTEFAFLVLNKTRKPVERAHLGRLVQRARRRLGCRLQRRWLSAGRELSADPPCRLLRRGRPAKPGRGRRLSTDGILPFSSSVDQPGAFARAVEDAALLVGYLGAALDHQPADQCAQACAAAGGRALAGVAPGRA